MKFLSKTETSNSKWRMILMMLIAVVAVVALISFIGVRHWYKTSLQPLNPSATPVLFVVAPGSRAVSIADSLESAELIKSSSAFNWYIGRENVRDKLQAGTYRLSAALSVEEIVEKLLTGDIATNVVTILPGKRLDEVALQMVAAGFSKGAVDRALAHKYNHPLLSSKPNASSLEGYIYPETYNISTGANAQQFIERTFDTMYAQITDEMMAGFKRQGLSLHEAIILASIVQQETPSPSEQVKVAQVFIRRLNIGMELGADPTFYYAAAISGQDPTPSLQSPYNTRINAGLPPGPIGNFNLSALEAVANPAKTQFLYFVAGDDGITRFSKTLEEHERLTREYCTELCF